MCYGHKTRLGELNQHLNQNLHSSVSFTIQVYTGSPTQLLCFSIRIQNSAQEILERTRLIIWLEKVESLCWGLGEVFSFWNIWVKWYCLWDSEGCGQLGWVGFCRRAHAPRNTALGKKIMKYLAGRSHLSNSHLTKNPQEFDSDFLNLEYFQNS